MKYLNSSIYNSSKSLTAVLFLMCLVGCGKQTIKKDNAYFSKHLDEAKQVWEACIKKGGVGMDQEEKETCAAAHNAWEFQPYKPSGEKHWSSAGGSH